MIFNDMTNMVIDLTNHFFPVLVGMNLALVVCALGLFAPASFEMWLGSLGRVVRRQLAPNRALLAR
jgi:hypothetical protein